MLQLLELFGQKADAGQFRVVNKGHLLPLHEHGKQETRLVLSASFLRASGGPQMAVTRGIVRKFDAAGVPAQDRTRIVALQLSALNRENGIYD